MPVHLRKIHLSRYLFYLIPLLLSMELNGQDKCGIVEVTQKLRDKKTLQENDGQFEDWLKARKTQIESRTQAEGTYRIPVVVHVIHNGEAVGTTTNISDAQVASQIAVLNKDFTRLNSDASDTPEEFKDVAGSLDIEFVLAERTPEGLSTTGIVRVKGSKSTWTINDDDALKAESYWPAEDYFNIWVTNLSSSLLGYAQFPVSDLAGLEDAEENRLTDGIVVDYTVFGSKDDGSFTLSSSYNKGRTATHETGHFFGLRHIWGDDDGACGGDNDYVEDTPDQGDSSSGCPSHPQTSCSVHTMFQNYMDYTNDACMNLFTLEQVNRMITVLENSPRRVSLLTSQGLNEPYANDLGIASILNPTSSLCDGPVIPSLQVKNYGTNELNSARIQMTVNNSIVETKDISFESGLATSNSADITFNTINLTSGTYSIRFSILQVDGVADQGAENDTLSVSSRVPFDIELPLLETFGSMPSNWNITNTDAGKTWTIQQAPKEDASNSAAFMNFFEYSDADGESDLITTPLFDLSAASSPYLYFDVAYAKRSSFSDGLKVFVLEGCEDDVENGTRVYYKSGTSLATVDATSTAFSPAGESDWRREVIDLSDFKGKAQIQLAFVAINDNGNNLYIDNVNVVKEVYENVAISKVTKPSPVTCEEEVVPAILITNVGTVAVTSLVIEYAVNDGSSEVFNVAEDFFLGPGEDTTITLDAISLNEGTNSMSFELQSPNGVNDIDVSDNTLTVSRIVNKATDIIPLRQAFDDDTYLSSWSVVNSGDGVSWQTTDTNFNRSLFFSSVNDSALFDEAWLVTPILDFSNIQTASVFFDLSYGSTGDSNKSAFTDNFRVVASTDCGSNYDITLFEGMGEDEPEEGSVPSKESDWTRLYAILNSLAGNDQVRLAFVFQNGSGGSIYLDNIEFFISDDPTPQEVEEPFVIYGTDLESAEDFLITFNLDERQDVKYDLIDVTGRTIVKETLTSVLNQTYQVKPSGVSSGIYIMRIQIGNRFYSKRVYIGH